MKTPERLAKLGRFYMRESVICAMDALGNSIHTCASLSLATDLPESIVTAILKELHDDGLIIPFFANDETQKYILSCSVKTETGANDLRRVVEAVHELTDLY